VRIDVVEVVAGESSTSARRKKALDEVVDEARWKGNVTKRVGCK
jgi:hypothetical protein